jgi:prepilin-type N-terminal cleavage/methylation domain-containing protein
MPPVRGATQGPSHLTGTQGFTLVELIVVIVILGILLAVAVPALTGYIAKAQDKQYIMDAKDTVQAVRAVLDEAYAADELTSNPLVSNYIQNGQTSSITKLFNTAFISREATGNIWGYYCRAFDLMGKTFPAVAADPGFWSLLLVGSADATALDADGFIYEMYPEGSVSGRPCVIVTYRMTRAGQPTTYTNFYGVVQTVDIYNADAGYEIYYLVK